MMIKTTFFKRCLLPAFCTALILTLFTGCFSGGSSYDPVPYNGQENMDRGEENRDDDRNDPTERDEREEDAPPAESETPTEIAGIDPFSGLVVGFSGISPYCTIALNESGCDDFVQENVIFSVTPDGSRSEEMYKEGDEVTVYAILRDAATDEGPQLLRTQASYTVENVPKYLTELTDDIDFSEFLAEESNYVTSIISIPQYSLSPFGFSQLGNFITGSDLQEHSIHFSALKMSQYYQSSRLDYFNRLDITHSILVGHTDKQYLGATDLAVDSYSTVYFTVYAYNIILYPDGTLEWHTERDKTNTFGHASNLISLTDLINSEIVYDRSEYNISEVTSILK